MKPDTLDVTGEVISPEHTDITPLFMRHLAAYRFFAGYAEAKFVLEVGFGEGYGSDYLAGRAASVQAVDSSQVLVEHARAKYARANLEFAQADATALPFDDGSFDVVISSQVLEHIKDYAAFIREAHRALKPGGTAIFATPNRKAMLDGVNPYHYKEFSAQELGAALSGVFGEVRMFALFGSGRYMALKASEQGFARKILALDFLRLRRFVPRAVIRPLYRLAFSAVNRRTEKLSGAGPDITVDDFFVSDKEPGMGLDLIGVCVKGA